MHSHSMFMCKLRHIQSRLLRTFYTFPFYWNPAKKLFTCDSKTRQTNFYRLSFIILIVVLFQIFQLIRLTYSRKFNQITYLYLELILNVIVVVHTCIVIWIRDEYLGFINGSIVLADQIARKKITLVQN